VLARRSVSSWVRRGRDRGLGGWLEAAFLWLLNQERIGCGALMSRQ
jgi:hypothetical protein